MALTLLPLLLLLGAAAVVWDEEVLPLLWKGTMVLSPRLKEKL
jgi:branched-subunit amino acid transport protein